MENTTKKKNYYKKSKRFYNHNYYNKSKVISYTKKFETFEEGFSEVIKYNPELKNYCGRDPILVDVVTSMLNSIKDNIPSVDNYNYPNTLSLSINAKEVGFKSDINIALGWKTEYDFDNGKTYYIFRVSFMTIPSYKKSVISDMVENGWNKINREDRVKLDKKKEKENTQKIVTIPKEKQQYVKLDQGIDTDIESSDSDYQKEDEEDLTDNANKESNSDKNFIEQSNNDKSEEEVKKEEKIITEKSDIIEEKETKLEIAPSSTDSVVASPVAGTFIITHNNQTSVININEPQNSNGLIIDKDNMIVTYPDGTKFNLKK